MGCDLQRAVPPREPAVPRSLRPGGDAAAEPRRRPRDVHPRAREMRRAVWQRGDQPEPRPVGRALDEPAAHRPPLVPDLRKDRRVRHPGDDPRQHELQRVLPHDRRALHQCRHDGVHAADPGRPVPRLPDAALRDPARRRRRALSLGTLSRPRAGTEEAVAARAPAEERLLRHLRVPPAGHRPADASGAGRRTSCSRAR